MATCFGSSVSPNREQLEDVLEKCKDIALCNAVTVRPASGPNSDNMVEIMPFALFPSVVPREAFQKAKESMTDFNRLMHLVAHDHHFLTQSLKNVIQVDDFTKSLWDIYTTVREEGLAQPISMGLFRNDFMTNCNHQLKQVELNDFMTNCNHQLKQVELNVIAAGSLEVVVGIAYLHRFSLHQIGCSFEPSHIPDNYPALHMAEGLVKAWNIYGNSRSVVLFLVSDSKRNITDQRLLEFKACSVETRIRVIRKTFADVYTQGRLTEDKTLMINNDEVAVIYFRSGYTPGCFNSKKDWEARLVMERSRAIKCPPIHYHLSGTKKIQQELARPGCLERFLSDKEAILRIRKTFTGQYSLDLGQEGDEAIKLAISEPHKYVLKPQREGGGNNLYGDDVAAFLTTHQNSTERNAYILMERIFPVLQKKLPHQSWSSICLV